MSIVRRNEVDIIVTDVRMSHMDGITLAKNVLESYPGVKIIFISGYADVGYLRDALKMEAVDYIHHAGAAEQSQRIFSADKHSSV